MGLQSWSSSRKLDKGAIIQEKSERLKALQDREDLAIQQEIKLLQSELGVVMDQEDIRWKAIC